MEKREAGRRRKQAKDSDEEMEVENQPNTSTADADLDVSLARDIDVPENVEKGALRYKDIYIPPPPPATCTFDNTGPRLVVENIIVKNFKSFYGEHIIGPFFKGMSAVIGPNGSGKSNVLDSILFVFGYRASKIRTKKVSMLIHNSSNHNNLPSCSVTVNFIQIIDKGPNVDPEVIPNTELVVSRTAMRDNSSYYTLDGRRVQFKDVATKLQNHGIDLTNGRFLILQGEVEQIAQMKPKGENENDIGLLEFLEDIMGTLRYREPLARAVEIDNALEEVREAQSEKVAVAEKALSVLGESKNEAIEYLRVDNQIMCIDYKLGQIEEFESRMKAQEYEKQKAKVEEKLKEVNTELSEAHKKTKEEEKTINVKTDEMEKMAKENERMDKEFKDMKIKDNQLREKMTSRGARRKKMKEHLKSELKKLAEFRDLPEKNSKEIVELEKLIAQHEKHRNTAEQALHKATEGLQREMEEPQQEVQKLEAQLAELAKLRDEKASAQRVCSSKMELCTKGEKQQKEKLEKLVQNLQDARGNMEQKSKRMTELKKELPRCKQELAEATEQLETERGEVARVNQRVSKLRQELQGLRSNKEQMKSRNRLVNALTEQRDNGNIPGIFGRLGDLGGIDAKYDCAISSSCGTLDHIVVDKVDTGEKCINFLRDSGVGRGNFIVLEKMSYWGVKSKESFDSPEKVPRLFDLVKVEDERVLSAFYFALRDTLVANDIEQASRIGLGGRQRFRVVDLNGNIVDPSGSITGGGQPVRGRMGQKVTAGLVTNERGVDETPQMKQNLDQMEARSEKLMQNILTLTDKERRARAALQQLEPEHRRLNMDINHLSESIPTLEQQVAVQEKVVKKTNSNQEEVKKLQNELELRNKELKSAQENAEKIEVKTQKLHKHMQEIKNSRVGGLDSKVKDLTKKINKAQTDKTKLSAAIAAVERNIQKSEEKIADLEQEITAIEREIQEINVIFLPLNAIGEDLLKKRADCSAELLQREEDLVEMKRSLKKVLAEELELKKKKHEVEVQIDKVNSHVTEHQRAAKDILRKLDAMKLEDIPGDDKVKTLPKLTDKECEELDYKEISHARDALVKNRMPRPNMAIIEEYRVKELQYTEMANNLQEAAQRRNEVKNFVVIVRRQRYQEFMRGFQVINQKLKEVFRMISMGGDAELELQDTFNPFLEGIAFSVRPCNKAWTQIDKLSGGEKTLSSLALVFGLHYYKPSPFYMMDEIDAALDARNVSIIGNYIKKFTVNCQFIVISLRPEMYDLFKRRVIGIFKPDGCSRCVCIDPGDLSGQPEEPESGEAFDTFNDTSLNMSQNDSTIEVPSAKQNVKTAQARPVEKSARKSVRSKAPTSPYKELDVSVTESPEIEAKRSRQKSPQIPDSPSKRKTVESVGATSPPAKKRSLVTETEEETPPVNTRRRKSNKKPTSSQSSEIPASDDDTPVPVGRRGRKQVTNTETSQQSDVLASDDNTPVPVGRRGRKQVTNTETSQQSDVPASDDDTPTPVVKSRRGRGRKQVTNTETSQQSNVPASDDDTPTPVVKSRRGRKQQSVSNTESSQQSDVPASDSDTPPLARSRSRRARKQKPPSDDSSITESPQVANEVPPSDSDDE